MTNGNQKRNKNQRRGTKVPNGQNPLLNVNQNVALTKPYRIVVPRHLQMFPDEFECWGKTYVSSTINALSNAQTFKLNGTYSLFGPRIDWAGAFAANVPSGSAALLTTPAAGGVNNPYYECTVLATRVQVSVLTAQLNPIAGQMFIVPSTQVSLAGVASAQMAEQRGVSSLYIPRQTETGPVVLHNTTTVATLFGVSEDIVRNDRDYSQVPGVDPIKLGYIHVYATSLNGVANIIWEINVEFHTKYLFRNRNILLSTVPV